MSMANRREPGQSIGQYAQARGVSEKTIRRWISQGKIAAELVPGQYGKEYRITELPGSPNSLHDVTNSPDLLAMLKELQQENRDLAGALGTSQEKVRTLEAQVLLLTDGRQPWWARLFGR